MNFSRIIISILFFSPLFLLQADEGADKFYHNFRAKLVHESNYMDKAFFKKIFDNENISKLFERVLLEEHELSPQVIISNEVRHLSKYPGQDFLELDKKITLIQNLSRKPKAFFLAAPENKKPLEVWQNLIDLNEPFRSFNEERQLEVLMLWRELFREKVQDYVAYRANLKPVWGGSITSLSGYDSNVDRTPDEFAAPSNYSGKDDFQQTFVASFDWKPFINNKGFSENWEFNQNLKMIYLGQSAHKENQMAIIDVEPKLTRKFNGFFEKGSLSYRYHNFYFNTNYDTTDTDNTTVSRDIQSYFDSHRLKISLNSKRYGAYKFIEGQSNEFNISYSIKSHADAGISTQDANDVMFEAKHLFYYSDTDYFGFSFAYSDYETDASLTNDYVYFNPKILFSQGYNFSWRYPFVFNETISYRNKKWTERTTSTYEEELTTISLSAATQLVDNLIIMLNLSQTFVNETDINPDSSSNSDQFKAAIGFSWYK